MFALGGIWRRRLELLDNLEYLKSRRLRLDDIVVSGVALGRPAAQALSARVLAARCASGGAHDGWKPVTWLRPAGEEDDSSWSVILRDILAGDGWLLLEDHVGLTIRAGEVRAIEIHRPALRHFCYIRSYVDLLHLFGLPDAVHTRCGDEGPVAHTLSYHRQHKRIVWDCRANALVVAHLGDFGDGPRFRRPPRGGRRLRVNPRPSLGIPPLPGAPAWGVAFESF